MMPRLLRRGRSVLALLLTVAGPARGVAQASRPDSTAVLLTRGISQTLARHRAGTISDVRYDLTLDVSALDSAVGQVTVRFRRSDTADVILDFRGRRLTRAVANGRPLPPGAARNGHILVPAELLRPGENTLEFGLVADIAPSGA
ncbi:MAG: aminopeptidase, partial [Gemmatimonadales bacterium]